jgi:hypothetical protein
MIAPQRIAEATQGKSENRPLPQIQDEKPYAEVPPRFFLLHCQPPFLIVA